MTDKRAGRWRLIARPIIQGVLANAARHGWDESRIKQALFDAYPFSMRKYHPYKVWLDEIKVQRGTKEFGVAKTVTVERREQDNPNQGKLFEP